MIAQLDREYLALSKARALRRVLAWLLFEGRPLTTRGRWINPLVFAWLRLLAFLPALRRVQAPVFIVGTGRSGTTLLGVLLSMHRDVGFLNEPKAIWRGAYADEDLVGNWGVAAARYRFGAADATPRARRALQRRYGGWLRFSGTTRLVDKYPELIFRLPLLLALFPDARVVWLQRNGDDTCRSVVNWSTQHGSERDGQREDWWGLDGRKWRLLVDEVAATDADFAPHLAWLRSEASPLDRAAVEWMLAMREGLRLQTRLGPALVTVRYEDLQRAPRATLQALCAACALPDDEMALCYAERVVRGGEGESGTAARPVADLLDPRLRPLYAAVSAQLGYA